MVAAGFEVLARAKELFENRVPNSWTRGRSSLALVRGINRDAGSSRGRWVLGRFPRSMEAAKKVRVPCRQYLEADRGDVRECKDDGREKDKLSLIRRCDQADGGGDGDEKRFEKSTTKPVGLACKRSRQIV